MIKIAAKIMMFFVSVVFGISIVSLATPDWLENDSFDVRRRGLWQSCNGQICILIAEDIPWQMWFARILMISGTLTLVLVGVLIAIIFCQSTDITSLLVAKGIALGFMASAIQFLAAMSAFTYRYRLASIESGSYWGHSFILGWVAFASCILLTVLAAMALRTGSSTAYGEFREAGPVVE